MKVQKKISKKDYHKNGTNKRIQASSSSKKKNNNLLMHERNLHRSSFTNYEELGKKFPIVNLFLSKNENGKMLYNFKHSLATYFLNKVLLKHYYNIELYLPYIYKMHDSIDFPLFENEKKYMETEKGGKREREISIEKIINKDIKTENVIDKDEETIKEVDKEEDIKTAKRENKQKEIETEKETDKKKYIETKKKINKKKEGDEDEKNPTIPEKKIVIQQLKKNIAEMYQRHNHELDIFSNQYELNILNKFKKTSKDLHEEQEISQYKNSHLEETIQFLCPCIPGRVNYIHLLSDLATYNIKKSDVNDMNGTLKQNILTGNIVRVLDIGVGASCIYPLLGHQVYKWNFVGTDISLESLRIAYLNILINNLENNIKLKFQKTEKNIFIDVIENQDIFFFSMCNPPFYAEYNELKKNPYRNLDANINEIMYQEVKNDATVERNNKSLEKDSIKEKNESEPILSVKNKTGINTKMNGGEAAFIMNMISESSFYFHNVVWFSSLVSKLKNVKKIKQEIIKLMNLYTTHGSKQIVFLDSIINEKLHFDNSFYFKNVKNLCIPAFISQYRILKSYQGKIVRWVICWSYYNEQQIERIKKLYYQKSQLQ